MRVGILAVKAKMKNPLAVEEMITYIRSLGYPTCVFTASSEIVGVDVVIVLGGDGAILHAAVSAAQNKVNIIGVNFGTLGFLTEYEKEEKEYIATLLAQLEAGSCRILKRSILQIEIGGKTYYALNEVALHRDSGHGTGKQAQLLHLKAYTKEGEYGIAGDGALLCTPTGSTAYALSAGGAILTPEVPVFMLTPICAFSMRARPIVVSDEEEIALKAEQGSAAVAADGLHLAFLPQGASIFVKKAPFTANFPVRDNSNFFLKVKTKLSE